MTECLFCKGPVHRQRIRHVHSWKGNVYIFNDVPAEVCQQCGEVYFEPQVLEQMDRLTEGKIAPETILRVPVFAFERIAA